MSMALEKFTYDNKLAKNFAVITIVWAIVAFLVGLIAAFELLYPSVNLGLEYLTFGRLRPLHTNAAIFAFVGNGIFTAVYYSMPRLLKTPMWSKLLGQINFWGWQLIIVLAAITLPMGLTSGKEYAELQWPIDILIALIWVAFGINMIMTMVKRRTKHIYVAIWFYIATFVTVAVLHIFNSFELPYSFFGSYSVFHGAQDAMVQWWYGHNAVAFFLTTPMLGLMYYFIPKVSNRPIYSYKLSIIHFWTLIFLYIWAGPHHLLYQAIPDWAQAVGIVMSIALLAPSWGGMINGLLTLRGAWDKVREDPVLKLFVVGVTAYGMSTFEGPLLSLKTVNAISHFTDWTIAHVHIGTLGWNGMMIFGMLYWLFPKFYGVKLYSRSLANTHFWLATLGMLFFAIPLYFAGFTQALMWKQFTAEGYLKYPNFLETYIQIRPMHMLRAVGGTLYLTGALIAVYNLFKTANAGKFIRFQDAEAENEVKHVEHHKGWLNHRKIEGKPVTFTIWALIVIMIGGLVEFVPMFIGPFNNHPELTINVKPYTPLELAGRDIYIKEGCFNCHSQMIRPFRSEVERYGEYSKTGEFVYNHPFQWGSRRTGPDLAREGLPFDKGGKLKKPDAWHYEHMINPQKTNIQSIMPPYPWLATKDIDMDIIPAKIRAMQTLGVPYPEGYDQKAVADLQKQAHGIAEGLRKSGIEVEDQKEIIAMIAYLQRLGTDIAN
ncbi:MAG: cytochrome-c oxidase, cbb3-type subunit I [Chlorobi bacterium]|nr:cytochrome-c oxidase, cbb3-type subunit I [Chlorobiota bacterium]